MRYSWVPMANYYSSDSFNNEDAKFKRKWLIIDNQTGKYYPFPSKYIYDESTGRWVPCAYVDKDLYNYEFYLFICATVPDFDQFPKEFVTEELLDIWVRTTSSPNRITIKEEWLNDSQKKVLYSRFKNLKPAVLKKHQ